MSKIGEKEIQIDSGVQVDIKDRAVLVKGPKGEIEIAFPHALTVVNENNTIKLKRKKEDKMTKSLHGLFRSLIANAIQGVQKPWEKKLEIVGTGFNAKMTGKDLTLKLGFSHPVTFGGRDGVEYTVQENTTIVVTGADKQLVGQTAHLIKNLKVPDVYKGKGIKYAGERLRIKPGKKAKAVGAA